MRTALLVLTLCSPLLASSLGDSRQEAEYYAAACAEHYRVPLEFVRALIEQESGWKPCTYSVKGAAGLMQLMPATAERLGVRDRCDIRQNLSGGVRYLSWLMQQFHGDLRLVSAAFYAGEKTVLLRGLNYSNQDVVAYVAALRERTKHQVRLRKYRISSSPERTP